jgi:protein-S-isoprenylcysteine O-methyltransferase Ste14
MTAVTGERGTAAPVRSASIAGRALRLILALAIPMMLLFGVAGRWDWPGAWAYMALLASGMALASYVLARLQPGLAQERASHWRHGKRWDRPLVLVVGLLGPISIQLVCGLDKRFGWSSAPPRAQVLAGVFFAIGVVVTAWALAVNPFFSATVRIQTDRGHVVVARGPYATVRHPGYAGMLLVTLASPILLGTLWGLAPASVLVAVMVARTVLEDRTLRAELGGYAEYAARVKYRLLPGVW